MFEDSRLESEESQPDLLLWFMRGGLAGVGVAILMFMLSLLPMLDAADWFMDAMDLLWPAALVMMAEPKGILAILFLAVALGLNFITYGLGALILALAMRLVRNLASLHHA
jgi:hypothetical protein